MGTLNLKPIQSITIIHWGASNVWQSYILMVWDTCLQRLLGRISISTTKYVYKISVWSLKRDNPVTYIKVECFLGTWFICTSTPLPCQFLLAKHIMKYSPTTWFKCKVQRRMLYMCAHNHLPSLNRLSFMVTNLNGAYISLHYVWHFVSCTLFAKGLH